MWKYDWIVYIKLWVRISVVSVISEIGVNWDGDFDVVREMITKSKNIGCDAVKFQSFDEKNLGNHTEKSK